MISGGMFAFLVKGLIGGAVDRFTLNYLGQKRGMYAQILFYFGMFYFSFEWLNSNPRMNVNHMINPRDFNGEIMSNLVLKYYPNKVN
jgi:hypothetical protein